MGYMLIKSLHLVFVIGWMAAVFYLPRILINIAQVSVRAGEIPAAETAAVRAQLCQMGRRLYRFGHMLFGLTLVLGLLLWFGGRIDPEIFPNMTTGQRWLHSKLLLVVGLLAYFIWSGRLLRCAAQGMPLPTERMLRFCNELPVFLLLGIVYLALAKPF